MINLIEKYFKKFVEKHKLAWAMLTTAVVAVTSTYFVLDNFYIIPLQNSNQSLEQQLIPFKTVALQKFSGATEDVALSALASRIGQLELSVMSLFDYQEISTWSFVGSYTKTLGAITSNGDSPASGWASGYVVIDSSGKIQSVSCNRQAISHYLDVIQKFQLYPFPYYVLALCQQKTNDPEWQTNMATAYKIVSITTTIPGHQEDHDALLGLITSTKK